MADRTHSRKSITLSPQMEEDLDAYALKHRVTKSDAVNRALRLLFDTDAAEGAGGGIYVREGAEGELIRVRYY
jgi:hypothetical protein